MKVTLLCFLMFVLGSNQGFGQAKSIRHLVLFKLKNGIHSNDSAVALGLQMMRSLPAQIKEIKQLECGANFSDRPIAVDFGLIVELENKSDLQSYLKHPAHLDLAKYWKPLADWTIADFEWQ